MAIDRIDPVDRSAGRKRGLGPEGSIRRDGTEA
jgi:hypothetical protein